MSRDITPPGRLARVRALVRAQFGASWGAGAWPAGPLVMHIALAGVLCGLVRDVLPPFAYALFALTITGGLILLPLLGDFAPLLRREASEDWIEAQPVTRGELRAARVATLLFSVWALSLASLLTAALLAPGAYGILDRIELVALGLLLASFLSGVIFAIQSLLGERAEPVLVLIQTALVIGVVLGLLLGPRSAQALQSFVYPSSGPTWLALFPPAWFAAPLATIPAMLADVQEHVVTPTTLIVIESHASVTHTTLEPAWRAAAPLASLAAFALLFLVPLPAATRIRGRRGVLELILAPARALATRLWVRRDERAVFDLVFDALPREREFVLRTYPMFGIPLAFLLAGLHGENDEGRQGLLTLLCFSPGIYLPILLVQVPGSHSHAARWILDGAPVSSASIAAGARKAIAVRFLVPLYAALFALSWRLGDLEFALRMIVPSALVTLLVLHRLYTRLVHDAPLSIAPDELEGKLNWSGELLTLAIALTVLSVVAWRMVTSWSIALVVCIALVLLLKFLERSSINAARAK